MKALLFRVLVYLAIVAAAGAAARRAPPETPAEEETIPLPENRSVVVALPKGFLLSTNADPRGIVTARITDALDQIAVELTFLPDAEGRYLDSFARKELMHEMYQEYLQGSVEKAMQFEELGPKVGKGTYCVFTDSRLVGRGDVPPNEYLNATAGVKAWPGAVALFTVLSNGTASREYRAAMTLLRESIHERVAPLR